MRGPSSRWHWKTTSRCATRWPIRSSCCSATLSWRCSSAGPRASFLHTPYAVALERTRIQRRILVNATRGRASIEQMDWDALHAEVHAKLPVLEGAH